MTEPPLCLCGCGTPAAYNPHKRTYNKYAGDRHRARYRDQLRRAANVAARATATPPPCGCGCGAPCAPTPGQGTGWLRYATPQCRWRVSNRRYWRAHGRRPKADAPTRLCACGCGQTLTGAGQRRYIEGHYQRPERRPDTGPLKDDLTPEQIERIITYHRRRLDYERRHA